MSEAVEPSADLGPTASIITIGDEIVEGRVLNENATWLSDELMTRGVWPRLVVAVPDVASMIVSVVRVAADAADLVFVTGGLGFTPDDITRHAVAAASSAMCRSTTRWPDGSAAATRGRTSGSPRPQPPSPSTPHRWRPPVAAFPVSGCGMRTCCPGYRPRCGRCFVD